MYVSQSGDFVEKNSTYGRITALIYASPPTRAIFIGSHDDVFLLQLCIQHIIQQITVM